MRKCIYFTDEIEQIEPNNTYWVEINSNIADTWMFLDDIHHKTKMFGDVCTGWSAFIDDLAGLGFMWEDLDEVFYRAVLVHNHRLNLEQNSLTTYLEILINVITNYEDCFKKAQLGEAKYLPPNHFIIVFNREDWDYYYNEILVKNMSAAELKIIKQVL